MYVATRGQSSVRSNERAVWVVQCKLLLTIDCCISQKLHDFGKNNIRALCFCQNWAIRKHVTISKPVLILFDVSSFAIACTVVEMCTILSTNFQPLKDLSIS